MNSGLMILIIAIGGAMMIEGAVYGLFPKGMKQAMREMIEQPEQTLRVGGLVVAALGFALICLVLPRL